jgi:hypothetical protein
MNVYQHTLLSVERRGGKPEDYHAIHALLHSPYELVSDERHRFLHTWWGIKHIIVPIFGLMRVNSDGRMISTKDICEEDHFYPDFQNKFLPTLADFTEAIEDDENDIHLLRKFHRKYAFNEEIRDLMLSPLANTGKVKSLFFTHNAWFVNTILPLLFEVKMEIEDSDIPPFHFLKRMKKEKWMDGEAFPPSQAPHNIGYLLTA